MKTFSSILISLIYLVTALDSTAQPCPNESIQGAYFCSLSQTVCDLDLLDGISGRLGQCKNEDCITTTSLNWCHNGFSIENPDFFSFIGSGEIVKIKLKVSNCMQGRGLQMGIFDSCEADYPTAQAIACDVNVTSIMNDLIIRFQSEFGKEYFLMIDGVSGDQCSYEIEVVQGGGPTFAPSFPTGTKIKGDGIEEGTTSCYSDQEPILCADYGVQELPLARCYYWYVNGELFSVEDSPSISEVPYDTTSNQLELCVMAVGECGTSDKICATVQYSNMDTVVRHSEVCLCSQKLPYRYRNQNIDTLLEEPGVHILTYDGVCDGCQILDTVTIYEEDELITIRLTKMLCQEDLEAGYIYPGQLGQPITINQVGDYRLRLDTVVRFECIDQANSCYQLLELIVVSASSRIVDGARLEYYINNQISSVQLELNKIVTSATDPDIFYRYAWYYENQLFSREPAPVVNRPGVYRLEISAGHPSDSEKFCEIGIYDFKVYSQKSDDEDLPIEIGTEGGIISYPDPVDQYLYVATTDKTPIQEVIIYSMDGKRMGRFVEQIDRIDVSKYPKGVYLLVVQQNNKTRLKKILKN